MAAIAIWLTVQAGVRKRHGELVALAGFTLAVSVLTTYALIVYLPLMFVFAFAIWKQHWGWARALRSATWLATATCVALGGMLTALHLWSGIMHTVLARSKNYDHSTLALVAHESWLYAGLIPFLAGAAFVAAIAAHGKHRLLLAVFATSTLVVPLGQAHSDTATSLDKHLALGLWLGAIGAGYACSHVIRVPQREVRRAPVVACCAVLLAIPLISGDESAWAVYHYWPNASAFIRALKPVLTTDKGPILVAQGGEGADTVAAYYTSQGMQWKRWTSLYSLPLAPRGKAQTWTAFYKTELHLHSEGVIVAFYKTGLSAPAVPGQMLFAHPASSQTGPRHTATQRSSGQLGATWIADFYKGNRSGSCLPA